MADNWGSLVGPGLTPGRVDQGVDFLGAGDVYALGEGVVTRADKGAHTGWPGEGAMLVYQITSGPAKGKNVYIAEDFAIRSGLKVGSRVTVGQVVGRATGSGKAPGIEVGFSNASGVPIAHSVYKEGNATDAGKAFQDFVTSGATAPADQGQQTPLTQTSAADLISRDTANLPPPPMSPVVGGNVINPDELPNLSAPGAPQYETWQQLAAMPGASPDTLRLAQLAGLSNAASG